ILAVAEFWLNLGVDGFRLDVVNFYTCDRQLRDNPIRPADKPRPAGASAEDPFFSQLNIHNFCQPETIELLKPIRRVMDKFSGSTTLAEISSAEDTILTSSEYVGGPDRLHMAYNSSLMTDQPLTRDRLHTLIKRVEESFGDGVICWTAGTHDFPRLKSRWSKYHPSDDFSHEAFDHMFAALIIALRGSCCIYQGDELGLTQADIPYEKMKDPFGIQGYPSVLGRDGSRTPMPWAADQLHAGFTSAEEPWLPIPAEHLKRAVDRQEPHQDSLLNKYRRLIEWRKQQPALNWGTIQLTQSEDPVLGFVRECSEQRLLCLFNLSVETAYYDLANHPECKAADETDFQSRRYEDTIELPPYGVYFGNLALE
ncbi:alpha-glucosidase, partial [filamentous cyanobacterium CCP5]